MMFRKIIVNWAYRALYNLSWKITTIDNAIFDMKYNKIGCDTPKLIIWLGENITPFYWLSEFIDCLWYFISDNDIDELIDYS